MLLQCPECELPVSDKALSCPHCGYPLVKEAKQPKYKSKKAHKRLPNGFGQISQIKGRNLRNPYRAMISVGKTSTGRPISKVFGFYETYNDAYQALIDYHKNPYDLDTAITISELYEKWTDQYFKTLKSSSSVRTITAAWSYCSSVQDMKAKDLRARHIKGCMDTTESPNIKSRIKSLFNLMLDFGLEYEIVERNYARTFSIADDIVKDINTSKRNHIPFTDDEMNILWNNLNINYVDIILIQCYTGLRPQELGLIKKENVDLEKGTMTGGMKTPAGIDRLVPIPDCVFDLVKARYDEAVDINSEYLFNCTDSRDKSNLFLSYDKYSNRFEKIISVLELNSEHRPHDPRKHFVTIAKKLGLDEYAIKYIIGHAIDDITEKIYTERSDEWLIDEMKKLRDKYNRITKI